MNNNPGVQTKGLLAWDGAVAYPRRIQNWNDFGFVFEVAGAAPLAADAVFVVQFHDADTADECTPEAGVDAPDIVICEEPIESGLAELRIPAGTAVGTICSGTVPCRLGKFVSLRHVSGGANVRATLLLQGPRRVQ